MSRENGQLLTCDRCGAWVFLECTGEGEADGGWTRWNKFEPSPNWGYLDGVGDICPKCRVEYENMLEQFKRRQPKEV